MKYKALLGCLVAAGIWSAPAVAGEVAVIKPEDQAVLEGIFAFEPVLTGTSSLVPAAGQEDGYGIQAKGARDVSRVQALPLVTKAKSGDTKAAAQAAKTGNTQVTTQAADVAPGNNLKAAMTVVVEGKESEKAGRTSEKSGADASGAAADVAAGKAGGEAAKETAAGQSAVAEKKEESIKRKEPGTATGAAARADEEIKYVYPSKNERETAREPLREWYNPAAYPQAGAAQRYQAQKDGLAAGAADEEARRAENEEWRDAIASCLDGKADGLKLEKAMLYNSNTYDAAAYLSQTFAEVNACYEAVGRDIIRRYYGDDAARLAAFEEKARTFYVGGTDVNFNPSFCGDNCSLDAVAEAQMQKFADFRTYLGQLLNERPLVPVVPDGAYVAGTGGETAADGVYVDDDIYIDDAYVLEETGGRRVRYRQ